MTLHPLVLLPLLWVAALPLVAQEAKTPTELIRAEDRDARLERDLHLFFGGRTAERARDALALDTGTDSPTRPGVLMALGCSGDLADVRVLEGFATNGRLRDRQAALLALGELGDLARGALGRLTRSEVMGVEEYLVLAWILADPAGAAQRVSGWADDTDSPLHEAAVRLADHAAGGAPPVDSRAVDVRLELRWYAARQLGLVDGRKWKDLLLAELLTNQEFLDRVVFGAAVERPDPSILDHLFEVLVGEHGPGVLPAAVRAMPEQMGAAIDAGIWAPVDQAEWTVLLEEIEDRRIEKRARRILQRAMEVEGVEHLAGIQLFRAGGELDTEWLRHELNFAPIPRRCLAMEAAGDRRDLDRVGDLYRYGEPGHAVAIQASSLVARARLGDRASIEGLRTVLEGGKSVERQEVLMSIARQLHDARLFRLVAPQLTVDDADPEVRFHLEVARAKNGHLTDRSTLREWLREGHRHELRRDAVRAIAIKPGAADLVILRDLFPVEDDLEVNVELAIALLHAREKVVNVILRTALWKGNWNRGVLAGGLLAQALSIHGLMDELDHPLAGATAADMRRVGFAIGEFGGLTAVTRLARRRPESDPALQGAFLGALSTQTQ